MKGEVAETGTLVVRIGDQPKQQAASGHQLRASSQARGCWILGHVRWKGHYVEYRRSAALPLPVDYS